MQLDTLVDDIVEIARIPAPTFAEEARVAWLERRLAGAGGRRGRDAAGNLIWRWGSGRPRVMLAVHVDTVFEADTPLDVRRVDGALLGPGVGDNAAAVATAIHVVSALLDRGDLDPGAVVFTVGEEGPGNLRGAAAACDALAPHAVVALEGHFLDRVVVDAVGAVRARLTLRGAGGHSWVDRGRPSAVHGIVDVARALLALHTEEAPVNLGRISGGAAVNAIAAEAALDVETRSTDDARLDAFAAALGNLEAQAGLELEVEPIGRRPAGALDRTSPLLAAVRDVRAALGLPDRLVAASTDAAAALARSIPALCIGVTTGSGMHSLAERIEVEPLAAGHRQLEDLLLRLLVESDDPASGTP